jgi:hypothetical protein
MTASRPGLTAPRESYVSQTVAGGGEAAGERHPENLVARGIPRRDL